MNMRRMMAIVLIFGIAGSGWMILGNATRIRSNEFSGRLGSEVEALWGVPLVQKTPTFSVEIPGSDRVRRIMPSSNEVQVALAADYRQKGLIWYPTYTCEFKGKYTIVNNEPVAQKVRVHFDFPSRNGTFDAFAVSLDGHAPNVLVNTGEGVGEIVELAPKKSADFQVSYRTRGLREWRYQMDPDVGRVQNLQLVVNTGFQAVDYPAGCLSPMSSETTPDGGMKLTWKASDLITREGIGITIPEKLNPGPLISRITYFAPVCLLFFFVLVATINILYRVNIHPMHYLFVAAGFFAFHLLLAYLADVVNIHAAFVTAAIVSVTLVTSYLAGALRQQFPWKIAIAGQLFFLVLFSYSFFFKGITGLTVAIGSVVTLAILMKVTAHVDWDEAFNSGHSKTRPPVPPIPSTPPEAIIAKR